MEDRIVFGALPRDVDPDMAEAMDDLAEKVKALIKEFPGGKLYVEVRLDIPQTGEFGTADLLYVHPEIIVVIDEKSGYVAVDVEHNEQMLTYLLGAIALYGPRPRYRLGIHQPNFDHINGTFRTWEPSDTDVRHHEEAVLWSVANDNHVQAGTHCKASYCPHRGSCEAFRVYAQNDLALGWHSSELKGMSDESLSKVLDACDELAGYRNEARMEAMRRIMNMDRRIDGYKVVKGRRNRAVRDPANLVGAIESALGLTWARRLFPELAWVSDLDVERPEVLKHLGTCKHIEDVIKQYARQSYLPRGSWKTLYDNIVGQYITETAGGLTLERAIDGRPARVRGSEFGTIDPATVPSNQTHIL
jgi:hypothetical protein